MALSPYSPGKAYVLSEYLCRTTLSDGDVVVNHLLGRVRLRMSANAARLLDQFQRPNTAREANRLMELSTRQMSEFMRALRHGNILQVPGNDEAERIRDAYRHRPNLLAWDEIEPPPGQQAAGASVPPLDDLRLADGLAVLDLDDDEILLGRPLEGPLHLTRSLWGIAERHLDAPSGVVRFLLARHVLVPRNGTHAVDVPAARPRGRTFSLDRPTVDRFRQIAQPYGPDDADTAATPLRILLVGPCQVQALAEALEWVGARRGYAVSIHGALDAGEVPRGERFDLTIVPAAQFATEFLHRLAFDDLASCVELIPEIVARCDELIDSVNHLVASPFLVLGLGRPTLTPQHVPTSGGDPVHKVLNRLSASLSQALTSVDASIRILDQDAAALLWGLGPALDDEFDSIGHHSPMACWSWVVLKPGVTDGPYDDAARARLRPPRVPGRTDPAMALANAIIAGLPDPTMPTIEAIAIDPAGTLWPPGNDDVTSADWSAFLDPEDYHLAGCREALAVLRHHGVRIAFVDARTSANTPGDSAPQPHCDTFVVNPDWDEGLAQACGQLGVSAARTLAIRCGAPRPAWWHGAWFGGSAWHLRRALLAGMHAVARPADVSPKDATAIELGDVLPVRDVRPTVEATLRSLLGLSAGTDLPRDLRLAGLDSLGALNAVRAVEEACHASFDQGDLVPGIVFDPERLVEAARRAVSRGCLVPPVVGPRDPFSGLTVEQWVGSSIASLLLLTADHPPDWQVRVLHSGAAGDVEFRSRRAFLRQAGGVGAALRAAGAAPGDRIVVAGRGWVMRAAALLGCLAGRFVPIVAAEPQDPLDLDGWAQQVAQLAGAARTSWTVCDRATAPLLRKADAPGVLVADGAESADLVLDAAAASAADPTAVIQCTSGSSGEPKMMFTSREQILTELWHVGHALRLSSQDRILTFLPQHHGFGMFMTNLLPLLCAVPVSVIPAPIWTLNPLAFLTEATRLRATLAFMTPSAAAHIATAAQRNRLSGIDLTSLRMLVWAGEPAAADTRREMLDALRPFGLRQSAMAVHYGMTDATSAVTHTPAGRSGRSHRIATALPAIGNKIADTDLPSKSAAGRTVLSCGPVLPSHTVRILDDDGVELPPGRLGHIAVSGRCLTTRIDSENHCGTAVELQTDDLGFMLDGELYPVGRSSDLAIVRGINVWPQAVEAEVVRALAVAGAACVAFGVPDPAHGTESLVVVAELSSSPADHNVLQQRIYGAVGRVANVSPSAVLLRPSGTIARLSSGKIDRQTTRARFLADML